jgi:hypothetical protein
VIQFIPCQTPVRAVAFVAVLVFEFILNYNRWLHVSQLISQVIIIMPAPAK